MMTLTPEQLVKYINEHKNEEYCLICKRWTIGYEKTWCCYSSRNVTNSLWHIRELASRIGTCPHRYTGVIDADTLTEGCLACGEVIRTEKNGSK